MSVECDKKRNGSRELFELRPYSFRIDPASRVVESRFGENRCLARIQLIHRPSPKNLNYQREQAQLDCRYVMQPWSTKTRFYAKSYANRRCTQISEVIRRVFMNTILLENYPRKQIYLIANMIQTDGGTRVCAVNTLSLALAHSTIAHKWLPVGTSFGKNPAGLLILDPDGVEDQFGTADVPVVFEYPSGKISLLQMEGVLTYDELVQGIRMASDASSRIYADMCATLEGATL
jgi:ribonuclease PH